MMENKGLWMKMGLLFVAVIFLISVILEIVSIARLGKVADSFGIILLFYTSLFFAFLFIYGIPAFVLGSLIGLAIAWVNK